MALILSEINQIEEFFYTELQKDFVPTLVNFRDRVRILTDTQMYKADDVYIWEQKTGRKAKYYQVYFDDEFVCGFDSTFPPEGIRLLFYRNLKHLVEKNKVYFNLEHKKIAEEKERALINDLNFKKDVEIDKIEDKDTKEIVKSLKQRNETAKKTNKS
jgi:hypothetical protein